MILKAKADFKHGQDRMGKKITYFAQDSWGINHSAAVCEAEQTVASPNTSTVDVTPRQLQILVTGTNRNTGEKCGNLGGDKTAIEPRYLELQAHERQHQFNRHWWTWSRRLSPPGNNYRNRTPNTGRHLFFLEHSVSWCLVLNYTSLLIPNSPKEVLGEKGMRELVQSVCS